MNELDRKKERISLIDQFVKGLQKRKVKMNHAFPCEDDLSFFVDDEDKQQIANAKKQLVKLDKELDKLFNAIHAVPCLKEMSFLESAFLLTLYATVYSDLRFDSNDISSLLLIRGQNSGGLVELNESIDKGNLAKLCYREERYRRGRFNYFFHSVALFEKQLFE